MRQHLVPTLEDEARHLAFRQKNEAAPRPNKGRRGDALSSSVITRHRIVTTLKDEAPPRPRLAFQQKNEATPQFRVQVPMSPMRGLDHTKNYPENIEVLKQGIKRGEEATTSSERLSYPKAKRRSKWRWTRRSVTMSQRRIYRSRRKGRKCKATNSSAMVPHRRYFHGVIDPLLSWRESVGR
ncbi:hypothetical protein GW17_00054577 [Ensete ventricosum]|nr:hypothetical protein GW17_00054577 [Ensete ventricosum]RZR96861.1 hypothetical protein BHM03_00025939 [Ensete ventricosum]